MKNGRMDKKIMTDDSLELLWRGSRSREIHGAASRVARRGDPFLAHAGLRSRRRLSFFRGPTIWKRHRALKSASTLPIWTARAAPWIGWRAKKAIPEILPVHPTANKIVSTRGNRCRTTGIPGEATSEAWSGADESMAEYLASALRENGIPSRIPDEPDHRARLCVSPRGFAARAGNCPRNHRRVASQRFP